MSLGAELTAEVARILAADWDIRQGQVVPGDTDVALSGGAVKLEGTVLYADLAESSKLATELNQRVAGKVIRAFLYGVSRLITIEGGTITSFDGDRVMGIFLGSTKNTDAAKCGLKINHLVSRIIRPQVTNHFASIRETEFQITHCVGIDTGSFLAVRAGQRGANDLVWIGRPPNLAAKLSELREDSFASFISSDVFNVLHESAKVGGNPPQQMWERRLYTFIGEEIAVYGSTWWWAT